ncbi:GPW/gp25 family protein [Dolichospermum sp. ST_sed3]|nr:GPW/gp25 family protein [Dolichospermum sp. ST_sed3]
MAKQINPIDLQKNIAVGIKLPLITDNKYFFGLNYTTFDQIRTNLLMLLSTEKGERIMQPNYGCDLRKMIFEQNNNVEGGIIAAINDAVHTWMPQVTIIDTTMDINEHDVKVHVTFGVAYDSSLKATIDVSL